ncbi:hypothetical protein PENTCL1PPCAC_5067, partial [Pristionchus entomophagus]
SSRFLSSLLRFHNEQAWSPEMVKQIREECRVTPSFVSEAEEKALLGEVETRLQKLPYEESHWDEAIHLYREREQRVWTAENEAVLARVRECSFPKDTSHLTYVHILDLHADGHIKPHIDSTRYCGDVITGISLLSSCVMRLRHEKRKEELIVDLHLPRRSLYRLGGIGRYEFTHEVLGEMESKFDGEKIERGRRISIICRDLPKQQAKFFAKMQPIPQE